MNKVKNIFVALAIFALVGCAGLPPTPKPLDPQKAVVGISIKIRPPIKVITRKPETVYFIKVGEGKDLYTQGEFIQSNYVEGGQAYFLNLTPGPYAAVGGFFKTMGIKYTTFFSKELIKLTEVTVGPGTIAFMGEYVVDTSTGLKGADDTQLHYAQLIAPGGKGTFYKGSLHEEKRDKQAEIRFLTNALEHFKDTGWIDIIQNRIEELKAD